jgi:uncharacterized protein with FMN-binding domain
MGRPFLSIGRIALLILTAAALVVACTKAQVVGGPVAASSIEDGSYVGYYKSPPNSAKVDVIVEKGRIAHVTLLWHGASWVGSKAEEVIPRRIVEEQSTDVDVVVGATNSSRVIMNAVQNALDKASGKLPADEGEDE